MFRLIIILSFCFCSTLSAQLPEGFIQELLVDELNPVGMTMDENGRIWIIEKNGRVLIVDEQGQLLPDPFLEIEVDDFNERGLEGIALHPDFDNNPYVYLYYTIPGQGRNRVSRFTANGDQAVPGSETVLLETDPLSSFIHNGGAMQFGADGMLYVTTGESGDPNKGQDLSTLLGKVLRLRPDGSIPEDNPFYDQLTGKNRAIYAYGLRNPFTMVANRARDTLFSGDVGSEFFEEVNHIQAGRNYGWPLVEGKISGQTPPENYTDPVYAYSHHQGCAIVGIAFNDPETSLFPSEYQNTFFFSDYCRGYIKYLDPKTGQVLGTFADSLDRPVAILFHPEDGTMYYLGRAGLGGGSVGDNTKTKEGTLWRVSYTGDGVPFISKDPQPLLVPVGESASFSVQALGKADLQYQWQENGIDLSGANQPTLAIDSVRLDMDQNSYRCLVTNSEGADTSRAALLSVTPNQRPTATILSPVDGSLFKAGDTIFYAGTALDPEEGDLEADAFFWQADWHHNQHTHPGFGPIFGKKDGFWIVPLVNETDTTVWYRLFLSVEDQEGLAKTSFVEIFPDLANLEVLGPEGVRINVDGKWRQLPHKFSSMKGLLRNIQAALAHHGKDSIYFFRGWSDGFQEHLRSFFTPEVRTTYEVLYEQAAIGTGEGLKGTYWNSIEPGNGDPVLERVDSMVDFKWLNLSPDPVVKNDQYSARWTGWIEPYLSDTYTFYVISDDGIRLWVNDSLVINDWTNHSTQEFSGKIYLEKGRQYSIRLEYFESWGLAEVQLLWSNSDLPKRHVPKSQLYPPDKAKKGVVAGVFWLDENNNGFKDLSEQALKGQKVYLLFYPDGELADSSFTDSEGRYMVQALPYNRFFLEVDQSSLPQNTLPGIGLNNQYQSPAFDLSGAGEFIPLALLPAEITGSAIQFLVSPNPVDDFLSLHFFSPFADDASIEIYTIAGQQVRKEKVNLGKGENAFVYPFGKRYPAGVYYAVIRIGKDVYRQELFLKE